MLGDGDCFSCSRTGICSETDEEKILNDYTCPAYEPVAEPVYFARTSIMYEFGELAAAQAMLNRPKQEKGG